MDFYDYGSTWGYIEDQSYNSFDIQSSGLRQKTEVQHFSYVSILSYVSRSGSGYVYVRCVSMHT